MSKTAFDMKNTLEHDAEFILLKKQLPEKGRNIIAIDKDGNTHYCFRCACHNSECREWRCSLTGYGLMIDIDKWIYEQK